MLSSYIYILILGAVSLVIAVLAVFIGHRIGPRRPNPRKSEPYESGMTAIGPAQRRVPVKFYRIAVLFILFDIEIIFMYPWAILFLNTDARTFLFVEMVIFVVVLLVGYVYAWSSGALEWD
jgi:NADH-quinone oxidoreductase subunit A